MSIIKDFRKIAQNKRTVRLFPNDLITGYYEVEVSEDEEGESHDDLAVVDGVEIEIDNITYRIHQESDYRAATDSFEDSELDGPDFRFREIYESDATKRIQPKFWPGDYVIVEGEEGAKQITDVGIGQYFMPSGGLNHSNTWDYWLEGEGYSYSEEVLTPYIPPEVSTGEEVILA